MVQVEAEVIVPVTSLVVVPVTTTYNHGRVRVESKNLGGAGKGKA